MRPCSSGQSLLMMLFSCLQGEWPEEKRGRPAAGGSGGAGFLQGGQGPPKPQAACRSQCGHHPSSLRPGSAPASSSAASLGPNPQSRLGPAPSEVGRKGPVCTVASTQGGVHSRGRPVTRGGSRARSPPCQPWGTPRFQGEVARKPPLFSFRRGDHAALKTRELSSSTFKRWWRKTPPTPPGALRERRAGWV